MSLSVQAKLSTASQQKQHDRKSKILICGDVEGKFNTLFNRVDVVNGKAGPFDLLLCVGNFFGVNNKEFELYKAGIKKVNVPTYILGPNKEEHVSLYPEDGSELCNNVHYLGKRGLYTTSSGIKIAYISGIFSNESSNNLNTYNLEDIVYLKDVCTKVNAKGIDVLITSQWPAGVMKYDDKYKLNTTINLYSDVTAWLAAQIRPRYHASGLEGLFYERAPFRSHTDNNMQFEIVTRFLGLARVDNPSKDKWLYALHLTPVEKMSIQELLEKTTDETQSPFNILELEHKLFKNKRKTTESVQYFYDMNVEQTEEKKYIKRKKIEFDQSKCWFCLASPAVEKHLVIAVGNLVYLVLAKGGIVNYHVLICPIEHHQCGIGLPERVLAEIEKFKDALRKLYKLENMEPVFFERNYKTSHMQVQVVPIPTAAKKEIKEIFKDEAEGHGFKLEELDDCNRIDQVLPKGPPYFYVELPNGVILYTKIHSSMNFPLNFGRQVVASGAILNLPEKIDWKDCELKRENEERIVQSLRKAFEPFDFTM
ncbi:hypothetical protein RN001_001393 [Aquatica leii]|uniref:CWF19-like protein 1 n=1 Tax=Aquatica leii TaxID=1421715 RepID=A0AAN7SJJ8_9COLE|nr:hypothetical protein RN001_001393 [Aquatica leii]